jgi:ABC-2 type transport system permease protein
MTLIIHELKINFKSFLIWFISVAALCSGCIFLFPAVKDTMKEMAESFGNMGGFSLAFGLDKLSIATMDGFFAAEIGTMYALGGAMYAALLGIALLSKEEALHTSEFLHTLPLGRMHIVISKLITLAIFITLFNLLHFLIFILSFVMIGEKVDLQPLAVFVAAQYLMHLEVAGICFGVSSFCKRNQFGTGLGLTLVLYMLDIISRITEKMENLKYITPFYYSNAADIFAGSGEVNKNLLLMGVFIIILCIILSCMVYSNRDLAS